MALKNATIGKDKSKAEKERELRAALDRNLDLQDQLRGAQEQLSKIPKKTWKKVQKNWYYNQEEAVKSAELYGKFEKFNNVIQSLSTLSMYRFNQNKPSGA